MYDPPSMCSKHENGFPAAHNHIANGNVPRTRHSEQPSTYNASAARYVFVSDDFVFVNSSNTHH